MDAVSVGLVGAGPWAEKFHAPMLAAGPETRLSAVWSRRPEAARALAARHGAPAAASFAELLAGCEAVAFAVPPAVQAELATEAARAGRALLIDKPLAITLEAARRLADAAGGAGVPTQMVLTYRYRAATRAFLARAAGFEALGARAAFLSNAFLRGPYAGGWRAEHGALHDLAPHLFDVVVAALGPVAEVVARGDPRRWIAVTFAHARGAVSELTLTGSVQRPQSLFRVELHGAGAELVFDAADSRDEDVRGTVRREFAEAVRSRRPHALDVRHGLALQELIERARRAAAGA